MKIAMGNNNGKCVGPFIKRWTWYALKEILLFNSRVDDDQDEDDMDVDVDDDQEEDDDNGNYDDALQEWELIFLANSTSYALNQTYKMNDRHYLNVNMSVSITIGLQSQELLPTIKHTALFLSISLLREKQNHA